MAFNGLSLGTTRVKASIPGFVSTAAGSLDVTVTEPGIAMVNMPTNGVGSGLQVSGSRAVLGASAHGGVVVTIKSSDPDLIQVSIHADSTAHDSLNVFVPNMQTTANFLIHALEDTTGTATITARAAGFSDVSAPVDNVLPGVQFHSDLGNTLDTIDPPDEFRVRIGVPINSNSTVQSQNVRTGGQPVVITVALDDSMLATLQTLADTSDTVTVVVDIGSAFSITPVASGGVALDGLAVGPVTLTASAPGFVSVTAAQKVVTITAPTIAVIGSVLGDRRRSPVGSADCATERLEPRRRDGACGDIRYQRRPRL